MRCRYFVCKSLDFTRSWGDWLILPASNPTTLPRTGRKGPGRRLCGAFILVGMASTTTSCCGADELDTSTSNGANRRGASEVPAPPPTTSTTSSSSSSGSPRQAAVAAEARALLEAAMRGIIEGWRAEAEAEAEACTTFDPKEDVLVILSGGVDSSLTFHLAASLYGVRHCITLLADEGAATDAPWCRAVAAYVGQHTLAPQGLTVDHEILTPTLPQLLSDDMPFLTQTLASFDPMALRNSICVARVLQHAKARGFRHVLTGDAADELLVGYSFSARLPEAEWRRHRQGMCARMHFDAMDVGKALGVHVASPYLDPAFVAFALGLSKEDCVAPVLLRPTPDISLADAPLTTTGKIPIRQAFPMLPTASRRKDPVEIGCGTTLLGAAPWATPPRPRGYFDERIDDGAFEAERAAAQSRHGIVLRDKEHLAYFRGFRALFEVESSRELSVPGKPRPNDDPCPGCGFPLPHEGATFCYTCGHYDAKLEFRHDGSGRRSTTGDGGGGGGGLEGV